MLPKNPPKTVNDNALKKRTNVYRKEDFNQEMKKEVAEVKEMTQVLSNQGKEVVKQFKCHFLNFGTNLNLNIKYLLVS